MAGALHKAMVYLGLTEEVDDRYEDEYDEDGYRRDDQQRRERDEPAQSGHRGEAGEPAGHRARPEAGHEHQARPEAAPTPIRRSASLTQVAPLDDDEQPRHAAVTPLPRRVRVAEAVNDVEVTGVHRITTIHPRTYNEAKKVGESFREGTPVIMNLSDLDDADAKRLVDFAAGLVFGLAGSIERVTNKVFLLSPADVEVTSEDGGARTTARGGLFNQS